MKLRKAKLLFSILCLAAALVLAVFVVYAWFITFKQVSTHGIDTLITSGDVTSFKIDYYYTASEDGINFKIGDKIADPVGEDAYRKMREFAPSLGSGNASETAVLLDMKIKFSKAGIFELSAKASHGNKPYNDEAEDTDDDFNEYIFENYLSNIIFLREVAIDGNNAGSGVEFTVDEGTTQYNFITHEGENHYFDGTNDVDKKNSSVDLLTYTVYDSETGEYEHHIYYLIDYFTQQINSIYTVMLQLFPTHAKLDTDIKFQHDIIFEIGKSDD